jgi:hypothetical protein
MIASTTYWSGSGNSTVFCCLRNATGQYNIVGTPNWQNTNDDTTKQFLAEFQDMGATESHYRGSMPVPDGGPWTLEFYAGAEYLGDESTPVAISIAINGTGLATTEQLAAAQSAIVSQIPAAVLNANANGYTVQTLIGRLASPNGDISPVLPVPNPAPPGYCTVVADLLSFGIKPRIGVKLSAVVMSPPASVNGYIIDGEVPWSVETDATGRAILPLPQGIVWLVTFPPIRMPVEIDTTNRDMISLAQIITS